MTRNLCPRDIVVRRVEDPTKNKKDVKTTDDIENWALLGEKGIWG